MVSQSGTKEQPRLLNAAIEAFKLPDLRSKILFTLGMLVVFRFIAQVPLPGIDQAQLQNLFESNQFLGYLNLFSGGAMGNMSVAALGVFPYITASIVIQLLTPVIPQLQEISKEGTQGRQKINQIVYSLTIPIALAQGYGQLLLLQQSGVSVGLGMGSSSFLPILTMLVSLTAGTMFLIWLGELITERGIGNGISLIIFAGIVSGFPALIAQGFLSGNNDLMNLVTFLIIALLIIALIVIFTEAHRRIPVQYGRSVMQGGRVMRQTGNSYIPVRVNSAGMIPLIFAFSIMIIPGTIGTYLQTGDGWVGSSGEFIVRLFNQASPLFWIFVFALVVAFTFFYTLITFQQQNISETLQNNGGFIPGIRPGLPTQDYLNKVILRITWGGAIFLGFVAVVPVLASSFTNVQAIQLSGVSLLIMVGVALDTLRQLEGQLMMRNYEGFLK